MRGRILSISAVTAAVLLFSGAAAGSAGAAKLDPPYTLAFATTAYTFEYGQYWFLEAHSPEGNSLAFGNFTAEGTLSGTPSGYTPTVGAYSPDISTTNAYMTPSTTARPLPPGDYEATLSIRAFDGAGEPATTPTPAHLTITPAALGITLQVVADPSNPANAIIAARFTGAFVDTFFSTSDPAAPLSPAGTWRILVEDADGEIAHEFSADRADDDDILAVSTYWSDVPPGAYTARAAFTPAGASADTFTISDASPVPYTAAAAPGSGSTAPPAPPAPPPSEDAGMTLPLWIPIVAGVLTAGLLALMIVQIVRLRRAGSPMAKAATP
jgi:hypothetical protein